MLPWKGVSKTVIQGISALLSGIRSGLARFDAIASNIANLNTPGFRSSRVDLQTGPGGIGVVVASTSLDTSRGPFLLTGGSLDVSIEGDSFFEALTADGQSVFTRAGSFRLDGEGFLVTAGGERVAPGIQIPQGATEVSITRTGEVVGTVDGNQVTFGRLQSVRFNNPSGLEAVGGGLFARTANSGEPIRGDFSQPGFGALLPGALEGSNTDLAAGFVDLLLARRFLQAQTATIRTADELLAEVINLQRKRAGRDIPL